MKPYHDINQNECKLKYKELNKIVYFSLFGARSKWMDLICSRDMHAHEKDEE